MLTIQQHNILANLFNGTFGKSSLNEAGHAIRHNLTTASDGSLAVEIRFECPINFNPRMGLLKQRQELDNQSLKAITEAVKNIKKEFKTISEVNLNLKLEKELEPEVEHISFNRDLVRARYKRIILYSLGANNVD